MLRTLHRILPPPVARELRVLTVWLTTAAVLQGVTLGLVGVVVSAGLETHPATGSWLIALAGAGLAFAVVQWTAQMVAFRVGSSTARALHLRVGDHLGEVPLGWFTTSRQAEAIDTVTDGVPRLMSLPAILLRPATTAVVTPLAAGLTLALIDWRATVAVLVASAAAWTVSRYSARLARDVDARRHRTAARATDRILEYASRQPLIRTDRRPDDSDALSRAIEDVRAAARRSTGTVLPGLLLFGVTLNALFAALIAAGLAGTAGAAGAGLSAPAFVGLIVVVARLTAVAASGAELAAGLQLQRGLLTRVAEILDTAPLPVVETTRPAVTPAADLDARFVQVEQVSFRYADALVLDEVSFHLPRRGLTALVGPSGSGKTTIARLLARFWDPEAGRIMLDGVDLRALPPDEIAAHLATVLQDDHLLDTTLGDNVQLGCQHATDADLARVIEAAGLTRTVAELPAGLDSPVGPDGSKLSGGQRQRVCVARALLKAAPLTLMDEATSALDPTNASIVTDAAERLAATGSVLVIAHNLDTVARADQVLVLERGRIVQRGTPGELAGRAGPYRDLVSAHAGTC
ncbi:ABC transporter ATP-binding protein [Nitriliruptor alkaliphilus]|uniref:ABC transporter ATP-binding protein n=1 Tax=Nitriliruptor alkaliphilus TaxID=427918 RepID=UPI000698A800|nr:ABC transporter ATP-binding protein [Nitriliruptor alkaliphilus]